MPCNWGKEKELCATYKRFFAVARQLRRQLANSEFDVYRVRIEFLLSLLCFHGPFVLGKPRFRSLHGLTILTLHRNASPSITPSAPATATAAPLPPRDHATAHTNSTATATARNNNRAAHCGRRCPLHASVTLLTPTHTAPAAAPLARSLACTHTRAPAAHAPGVNSRPRATKSAVPAASDRSWQAIRSGSDSGDGGYYETSRCRRCGGGGGRGGAPRRRRGRRLLRLLLQGLHGQGEQHGRLLQLRLRQDVPAGQAHGVVAPLGHRRRSRRRPPRRRHEVPTLLRLGLLPSPPSGRQGRRGGLLRAVLRRLQDHGGHAAEASPRRRRRACRGLAGQVAGGGRPRSPR